MSILNSRDLARARGAIAREERVCSEVADEYGQIFENVRHMTWFVREVALFIKHDRERAKAERELQKQKGAPCSPER